MGVRDDGVHVDVEYEVVTVISLKQVTATSEPESHIAMYDVHLREGHRSYHACDFVSGINYPEITRARFDHIAKTSGHLPATVRREIQETIGKLEQHGTAMGMTGGKPHTSGEAPFKPHHNPRHHARVHAPHFRHMHATMCVFRMHSVGAFISTTPTTTPHPSTLSASPQHMVLSEGNVCFGGQVADGAYFMDDGTVLAKMPGKDRFLMAKLHPHGISGHAVIATVDPLTQELLLAHTVQLSAENDYSTNIKLPFEVDGADLSTVSLQLHIGLKNGTPVGFLFFPDRLPDADGNNMQDDLNEVLRTAGEHSGHLSLNTQGHLTFRLDETSGLADIGLQSATITVSGDANSVSGTAMLRDPSSSDKPTEIKVSGHIIHALTDRALASSVLQLMQQTRSSSLGTAQAMLAGKPHWVPSALMLADGLPMSVQELADMAPPDPSAVNDLTFAKLEKLMKKALSSDDRRDLLGETDEPSLNNWEQEVLDKEGVTEFLKGDFFAAYLGQSTAGKSEYDTAYSTGIEPKEAGSKLKWYWRGSGERFKPGSKTVENADDVTEGTRKHMNNVLSKSAHFAEAQKSLAVLSFVEHTTPFQRYMAGNSQEKEKWAKKLYAYVTTPAYLNLLATSTALDDSHCKLNKISMMLLALAPDAGFAQKLVELVLTRVLTTIASNIDMDNLDIDLLRQLNMNILEQIADYLANGKVGSGPDAIPEEFLARFQDDLKSLGIERATEQIAWLTRAMSKSVDLFKKTKGALWERIEAIQKEWGKTAAAISFHTAKATCLFMAGASMYMTITQWKQLSEEGQAIAVLQTLGITFQALEACGVPFEKLFGKAHSFLSRKLARQKVEASFESAESLEMQSTHLNQAARTFNPEVAAEIPEDANAGMEMAGRAIAEVSVETEIEAGRASALVKRWSSMTGYDKISRAGGLLASAAVVIWMSVDLAKAWGNMSRTERGLNLLSTVAFGVEFILNGVAMAAQLGVTALDFMASSVVPIAGPILLAIGIIASIVIAFIPKKHVDTPAETYIKDNIIPLLSRISTPSDKWLNSIVTA